MKLGKGKNLARVRNAVTDDVAAVGAEKACCPHHVFLAEEGLVKMQTILISVKMMAMMMTMSGNCRCRQRRGSNQE